MNSEEKTVLLVVDVQQLITTPALYKYDTFISTLRRLIGAARDSGTEVIYVRHDDGEDKPLSKGKHGYEIFHDIVVAPGLGELIFDKTVNSPFKESGLLEYLKGKGVTRLIITGLQTEFCIDAAVKCGFEHGFKIVVPEYANTTVDNDCMTGEESYEYYNRFIWKDRYASCVTAEEAEDMMKRG